MLICFFAAGSIVPLESSRQGVGFFVGDRFGLLQAVAMIAWRFGRSAMPHQAKCLSSLREDAHPTAKRAGAQPLTGDISL